MGNEVQDAGIALKVAEQVAGLVVDDLVQVEDAIVIVATAKVEAGYLVPEDQAPVVVEVGVRRGEVEEESRLTEEVREVRQE